MKRLAVVSMITLLALSMVFSTGVKEMVENGTLVLPGTEELNRPFENLPLNNNIS